MVSLSECADDIGIHINTMCKCFKSYPYYEKNGFIYSYNIVGNYNEKPNHPNAKFVYKYKDNEKIQRYKSISECAKSINISTSTLSKKLKNENEYKYKGFTYTYNLKK